MHSPMPAIAHVKPKFEMARCREFTSSKDNRSGQNGRVVTKWLKMRGEATKKIAAAQILTVPRSKKIAALQILTAPRIEQK